MSKTPVTATEIEQAKRDAADARARIQSTVGALKYRLAPSNLAADAKEKVRETTSAIGGKASGAVRKRPIAASAAAGVAALVLLRKPLGKLRRLMSSRRRAAQAGDTGPARDDALMRAGAPPKPSVTPRITRAVAQSNAAATNKE